MAVYSMTGFGSAISGAADSAAASPDSVPSNTGSVGVELRSVNGRFLDFSLRLPDELRGLEPALRELVALTRARGIQLILIHPAYRLSKPHRCLLTRLAAEERVPVLDVEDLLAVDATARGLTKPDYFRDSAHPNEMGHDVIGRGLAALFNR